MIIIFKTNSLLYFLNYFNFFELKTCSQNSKIDLSSNNHSLSSDLKVNTSKKTNKLSVDILRTKSQHKACIVCRPKHLNQKLRVIPIDAIIDAYVQRNILVPENGRCCSIHLDDNGLLTEESLKLGL